jgi:hypothetical protein
MATFRTRRTLPQTEFFILTWSHSNSTAEVASTLRRERKGWPFSVTISSLSQFASHLRATGVELPYMDHRGNELQVDALNAFLASC